MLYFILAWGKRVVGLWHMYWLINLQEVKKIYLILNENNNVGMCPDTIIQNAGFKTGRNF